MTCEQSTDGTERLAERVLDAVDGLVGVHVYDAWTDSDNYLFRGPHGLLESIGWNKHHECWTRSPYCRQPVLRSYVEKAIGGSQQYVGWNYVTRDDIGEPKPVAGDPVRCSLCGDEFDGGNPFAWHLADDHELAEDKHQMEFGVKVPTGQQSLARYVTDGGTAQSSTETENGGEMS